MYAGSVTDIKTYMIDVAVVVVIVTEDIADLDGIRRYGIAECRYLRSIMRKADTVIVGIDIRDIS